MYTVELVQPDTNDSATNEHAWILHEWLATDESSGYPEKTSVLDRPFSISHIQSLHRYIQKRRKEYQQGRVVPSLHQVLHGRFQLNVRRVFQDSFSGNKSIFNGGKKSEGATPPNQERLQLRREYLLQKQEENMYARMIGNRIGTKGWRGVNHSDEQTSDSMASAMQQLHVGVTMLAARVTAFIAGYVICGNLTQNETKKLMAGLVGAVGMMMVEMMLHITRSIKRDEIDRLTQRRTTPHIREKSGSGSSRPQQEKVPN